MQPKMIWANVAVTDLAKTAAFYTALGFKPNGTHGSNELVSFLFGDDGFAINFFLKDILKANLKTEIANAHAVTEIMFTLSAQSIQQANDWAKEVENAGGKIIDQPAAFGPGYYGFTFADPDGHRFNVFYMEGL